MTQSLRRIRIVRPCVVAWGKLEGERFPCDLGTIIDVPEHVATSLRANLFAQAVNQDAGEVAGPVGLDVTGIEKPTVMPTVAPMKPPAEADMLTIDAALRSSNPGVDHRALVHAGGSLRERLSR